MKKFAQIIGLLLALNAQLCMAQANKEKKGIPLVNPVTNCKLRYYYYPNIEAYFDTQKSIYYYKENGAWQTADEIPNGYRGYAMSNKFSVYIIDYDDDDVCQFIDIHKKKYPYMKHDRMKQLTDSNY